jgi:hypothetical protein
MTTVKPFGSNTLPTFQYEPFSYVIYSSNTPLTKTSETTGILEGYLTIDASAVLFRSTNNLMSVGTQSFTITDASSNVSSNIVTIGAGRFRDPSNNSISGSNYVFYKNEPITPIRINAPFAISLPTASPILPPGLAFYQVDVSTYDISGIPTVTVPQSNYLFLGKGVTPNLGKIITSSNVGMIVSNERMLLNLSGSPIVSNMTIGSAIDARVITARFPPYTSTTSLTYSWSPLPDGIVVKNSAGVIQSGLTFNATDSNYTLRLEGTPTLEAAKAFQLANITSNVVNFVATRTAPPLLTSNVPITFAFGPTVLFISDVVQNPLYKNLRVDPAFNYFTAQTYFPDGSGNPAIANIFATTALPNDLSLSFTSALARSDLSGIPTVSGSGNYTIRAINSNGIFRDLDVSINVSNDAVTFSSPATDACYNFIETRPLSNALTGYYPSPIVFRATAASGSSLTFSATGLPSGITLSQSTSTSATLVGSSTDITPLTRLRVKATALTDASGTRDVSYAVLPDTITFNPVASSNLSFIQNRTITPFLFTAVALSERPVISYTSSNLPAGISLATVGAVSGTPTGNTDSSFNVIASTGFSSTTKSFPYTLLPDAMLLIANPLVSTYPLGGNVSIDVNGVTYSGRTVSNYAFSNFTPSYGLSINSTTGMITGTLPSTGVPPEIPLPTLSNFAVTASAGTLDTSINAYLATTNPPFQRYFAFQYGLPNNESWGGRLMKADGSQNLSVFDPLSTTLPAFVSDLAFKNSSVSGNTILMCDTGFYSTGPGSRPTTSGYVYRSTGNGAAFNDPNTIFETPPFAGGERNDRPYKAIYDSNTSTWYVGGTTTYEGRATLALFKSTDDGISFSRMSVVGAAPRQCPLDDGSILPTLTNWYTAYGTAFAYANGVFLLGGSYDPNVGPGSSTMKRSTDGITWTDPTGGFEVEVANICTDGPVWVATGSARYGAGIPAASFPASAVTLKWSNDNGATWNNAGGFPLPDILATEVAYASNIWLAAGLIISGGDMMTVLVASSDGMNWSLVNFHSFTAIPQAPQLPEISSIFFDQYSNEWNVFIKTNSGYNAIYSHPPSGDITTGWTVRVDDIMPFVDTPETKFLVRIFGERYLANGPTTITIGFPGGGVGPTITSPTTTSFTFYQYVTIDPITISATGTGFIYYFVDNSTLPAGVAFDPLTGKITGQSVELGQKSFIIYMKDDVGITALTISTNTIIPRVIRQQTSAGAWTSLVRQYTVVNAAQNSVNGHVLAATEAALGEFTRPEPPDSVSATGNPNCAKTC